MKIVVDTTVFAQGFDLGSADVRLLQRFIERTGSELCVPNVVLEEAVNLVRKSLEEVNSKLAAARRLTADDATYASHDVKVQCDAYRKSLSSLLEKFRTRILPYPNVSHEALMRKALAPSKPFVSSGRGYRDALIWSSLLELAKASNEEITFISANSSDFCISKNDFKLHEDLIGELGEQGVDAERLHLFDSVTRFVQKYEIAPLPPTSPGEPPENLPNYRQLLVDGKEAIESMLAPRMPKFLQDLSRFNGSVDQVELVALAGPEKINSDPIKRLEAGRRLLQFSGEYRISLQFVIRRTDLPLWSQRLSFQMRQDWSGDQMRVTVTIPARVVFHLITHGEETEAFSISSISRTDDYMMAYLGLSPVAIRLNQTEIHAPEHQNWGTVKCSDCGAEFAVGHNWLYPEGPKDPYLQALRGILAADHQENRPHQNIYELRGLTPT